MEGLAAPLVCVKKDKEWAPTDDLHQV